MAGLAAKQYASVELPSAGAYRLAVHGPDTFLEHGQTNKHTQLKTLPVHVGGFCATSPEHQSPILYAA